MACEEGCRRKANSSGCASYYGDFALYCVLEDVKVWSRYECHHFPVGFDRIDTRERDKRENKVKYVGEKEKKGSESYTPAFK